MKVLHVITTISRGGAENHLLSLVREQRLTQKYQVTVAYLKGDGYWRDGLSQLGVPVLPLGLRYYGQWTPLQTLVKLMQEESFDLVHAHMPPAELYAAVAILLARSSAPLVVSKHNDARFSSYLGSSFLEHLLARRADGIIAISKAVKHYFEKRWPPSVAAKTVVIPYGIDAKPFLNVSEDEVLAARRSLGLRDQDFVFGTVARLVEQKGIDTLLHGFKSFIAFPGIEALNPKLVIVGKGAEERALKKLSSELGLEKCVIWAGPRFDIPMVMRTFDVFGLCSRYEGFGLVLLEAMASARPVVASCVSAIPEVVADGVTGILVEPDRPLLLAQAFKQMLDPALRQAFGRAGQERARLFTEQRMAFETAQLYSQCLGEQTPSYSPRAA